MDLDKKRQKLVAEFTKFLDEKIGWGYLHISDGVDSCSGTDEEEEAQAKEDFLNTFYEALDQYAQAVRESVIEEVKKEKGLGFECMADGIAFAKWKDELLTRLFSLSSGEKEEKKK